MFLFAIFLTEFSPNPVSPQTEWVELYNDSNESTDISGYIIRDSTISNKQILSGIIPPQSYFTYSFDNNFLNNTSSDIVKLFDKNNNLIDNQSSKPLPIGLSFSKQGDGTWCPTDNSPNLVNNLCKNNYSLLNSPTPIQYISLKIINIDANNEKIEISNPNNFSVNLFDWRVIDNSGSVRKLTCTTIDANSNCIASFSSGYLNNDTDKLTLLDPLKREISVYSYENLACRGKACLTPTVKKMTLVLPTSISKVNTINMVNKQNNISISSKSANNIQINKTTPIHNYLSIILMFIGSIFILSPLIFHAKFNKK